MAKLLLAWIAVGSGAALGQESPAERITNDPEYVIERWETDQGLPENSATAMVQDRDGYLWFGTFHGLVRYDGVRFRVYTPENTPGLVGSGVVNLYLDRSSRMWVSTYAGMSVMQNGVFAARPASEGWAGLPARSFAERSNGDLLVTTFDGHLREFSGGAFRSLPVPDGAAHARGFIGCSDESGRWTVMQRGLAAVWDGQEWSRPEGLLLDDDAEPICGSSRDGGVWVLQGLHLRKFRGQTEILHIRLGEFLGGPWSLHEDWHGNVWVCSYDQGLSRVNPKGEIRRWRAAKGLAYDGVRFMFEDREHSIWVGTSGGGLSRFTNRRFRVAGDQGAARRPVTSAVSPDGSGRVWFATYDSGLQRLENGVVSTIDVRKDGKGIRTMQSVLADSLGRVWVGTLDYGLCMIEGAEQRWFDASATAGSNIIALFEDSGGRVWTAGGAGVAVFESGRFRAFGQSAGLPMGGYCALTEDRSGRVLVSNLRGVFRNEGDRFVEVLDPTGRPIEGVGCLRVTEADDLWMGRGGGDLLRLRGSRISRVGLFTGASSGSIHGIVEDGEGAWWIATDRGVMRVLWRDLESAADGASVTLRVQRFDRCDGLASVECSSGRQPVCGRDAAGRLWFATLKGVVVTDPRELRLNDVAPTAVIEEVSYASDGLPATGDARDAVATIAGGEARLGAGCRRITIRYTGLSLAAPGKVQFETQMTGLDSGWRPAERGREATFYELPPGRFTFRVRAMNNDGLWGEAASLDVVVAPFYWQTWWFRAGLAGVLLVAGSVGAWWVATRQYQRTRERIELQQQRNELVHLTRVNMMGELSGSLAHELNQPLTAILANAQAAQRFLGQTPADLNEVREILSDIVREDRRAGEIIHRLRQLLKKGELNYQPVEVRAVVDEVLKLTQSDLAQRNVTVILDHAEQVRPVRGDPVQLQQVVLNLILNACESMESPGYVPEASGKRLTIGTRREGEDRVTVSVEDVGPGIAPGELERIFDAFFTTKKSGMGLGLAMCRTIVTAHGGRLWAENNVGRGAVFRFTLPMLGSER